MPPFYPTNLAFKPNLRNLNKGPLDDMIMTTPVTRLMSNVSQSRCPRKKSEVTSSSDQIILISSLITIQMSQGQYSIRLAVLNGKAGMVPEGGGGLTIITGILMSHIS